MYGNISFRYFHSFMQLTMYPTRPNLSTSQHVIEDKDQRTICASYRLRITQALMEY